MREASFPTDSPPTDGAESSVGVGLGSTAELPRVRLQMFPVLGHGMLHLHAHVHAHVRRWALLSHVAQISSRAGYRVMVGLPQDRRKSPGFTRSGKWSSQYLAASAAKPSRRRFHSCSGIASLTTLHSALGVRKGRLNTLSSLGPLVLTSFSMPANAQHKRDQT
jgi:hypothetical protein